jgi:hypothetical protein
VAGLGLDGAGSAELTLGFGPESHYPCARLVVDSGKKIPMPIQPTLRRAQPLRRSRTQHVAHRGSFPTVGQCFDIEVTRETNGWLIRSPEIGGVTRTSHRATVELTARECIAARTGIPIGYVAIFVAREIG